MAYIPHGADQQGRRITGVWVNPRRTYDDGHFTKMSLPDTGPDTIPTDRVPLEAAHAASEWDDVPTLKRRHGLRLVAAVSAVAVLALVVIVATMGAA